MDIVVCSNCGGNMERVEIVNGEEVDWSNEDKPICPKCRGIPGGQNLKRKRDVLGGFPWKRDADGKKVPR